MSAMQSHVVRAVGLATMLALFGLGLARDAHAHGGNFRADQPVPPGEPVAPVADVPAPVITPRGNDRGVGPRGRGKPWMSDDDWQTWWNLNALRWSPPPGAVRTRGVVTPGDTSASPFGVGEVGHGRLSTREMERELARTRVVEPLLLRLTDPTHDEHPDVRSSAMLALGRMSRTPAAVDRLLGVIDAEDAPLVVRESALLGLGLLRRSERLRQRSVAVLETIRRRLLCVVDRHDAPVRLRAFAAYALGLLGDQPFPSTSTCSHGRAVSRELWQRLDEPKLPSEMRIALLGALALQPREGIPSSVHARLSRIVATRGRVPRARWNAFERAHAVHLLAKLRPKGSLQVLLDRMADRRDHAVVRAAAVLAAGHHAATYTSIARQVLADRCVVLYGNEPHVMVRGLHLLTMGQVLRADLEGGENRLVVGRDAPGTWLLRMADAAGTRLRPYAALGLALTVHATDVRSRGGAIWRRRIQQRITRALVDTRGAHEAVSAWAVASGVAEIPGAAAALRALVTDRGVFGSLRQRAAAALGIVSDRPTQDRQVLLEQLRQRRSGALFLGAVRGLALLGEEGTAATLGEELARTRNSGGQAAIAIALGRLRDPAAVPPLRRLLEDPNETRVFVRSYAAVALGLLCDPERIPSKARLTVGACYPARTIAFTQIMNIL